MKQDNQLPQVSVSEDVVNLGIGQPSNHLLPLETMGRAAAGTFEDKDRSFLAYGAEKGMEDFRQTLADFLTFSYGYQVTERQILVTCGNSQALDYICSRFSRPGDRVLVEEPSYFLALKIFSDRRLVPVAVPVDDKGLVTDALEEIIAARNPCFLYTIPSFHNPSGITLTFERREKLVKICRKKNLLVVADEVYHLLGYDSEPPFSMGHWAGRCPVVSLGSFSKILAPGLRLGWMQADPGFIDDISKSGLLLSGGGFNPFTSRIVNHAIKENLLLANIKKLRKIYSVRLEVLYESLVKHLPGQCLFFKPAGGYFIWIRLPKGIRAQNLRKKAKKAGVDFQPGHLFSPGSGLEDFIRVSFAFYGREKLAKGAKILGKCIKKCMQDYNNCH